MKISNKLSIGFSLIISLSIIVGVVGIIGMQRLLESGISMYEKQVVGLELLGKASSAFKDSRIECSQVVISSFYDDLKGATDAKQRHEKIIADFEYWMNEFYDVAGTEELIKFHDRIMALLQDEYLPKAEMVINTSINDVPDHDDNLEINVLIASAMSSSARIEKLLIGIVELESALAKQESNENTGFTMTFIVMQYFLLFTAVMIAALVGYYITDNISKPIREAADVLHKIAQGHFEERVIGDYKGEFGTIKESVNKTAMGIKTYIRDKLQAERAAYESDIAKGRAEAASEAIISSIHYASKIQKNLLPKDDVFSKAFSDCSVIWSPRDIVGGDIYWLKLFDEGTILCVCDCTGHGTPGALLTMLVVSAFEATVDEKNCSDTAQIMWQLDQRLINVLNANISRQRKSRDNIADFSDGCDLAILFVAKDGSVTVSTGSMHVFYCDGKEVTQIKGQRLRIGEGNVKSAADVKAITIPANPNNKFYIASDGLYDQIGGAMALPFGYKVFKSIILENHNENQSAISTRIWEAFESYRGEQFRRDDVELISFKP